MQTILIKVVKELNISIPKAVKILTDAGSKIKDNPMSKVTEQEYFYLKGNLGSSISEGFKKEPLLITSEKELGRNRLQKGSCNSVFKYFKCSSNNLDGLKNKYLYYSKYQNFNDPFDCSMDLIDFTHKRIKYGNKQTLFAEKLKNIGICCFSRNNDSILMWSHYGDNHKGFCIEFHSNISQDGINPIDVVYKEDFIKANYISDSEDSIFHLIYSKSKEWEYEHELRSLKTDLYNIEERKVKFENHDVKAIYLGVNCSKTDMDLIIDTVNKDYDKETEIFKAVKSSESFEIRWEKVVIR